MKINNKDTEVTWKAFLEDGGANTFLQVPKPKARFTYNWPDANGVDVDDSEDISFEPMTFAVPLIFYGSMVSVNANVAAFIDEIKTPFALSVDEVTKNFAKCYFNDSGNATQVADDPYAIRIEFTFRYNW